MELQAGAWHERFEKAVQELVALAGGDAGRLREAIGPVRDSIAPMPMDRRCSWTAATTVEPRGLGERSATPPPYAGHT